jgi:hypothetical protein
MGVYTELRIVSYAHVPPCPHYEVHTGLGATKWARRERGTFLQHLPTTLRSKHSGERCSHEWARLCMVYIIIHWNYDRYTYKHARMIVFGRSE